MDTIKNFDFLIEDLLKQGLIKNNKQFYAKVQSQLKDIIRSTLYIVKDK